ncbi:MULTISPECIES: hypothetical protein [Hydrotalea]|nr:MULTISPECIES: hypothetical protein [Hydrotalea]
MQLDTTQFRKPPFDSVPNLMRPPDHPTSEGILVPSKKFEVEK